MRFAPRRALKELARHERVAIALLLVGAVLAFAAATGPVRWVFVGAAVAIAEETLWGFGYQPSARRPRGWLVCACLSPVLPFVALGTADVGRGWGLLFGFLVTVIGWRFSVRPALRDTDEPLTPAYAALPAIALLLVAFNAVVSPGPLSALLLGACLTLWAAALVAIPVLRLARHRWRLAWPARTALVAGACALIALGLAAHDLARVDGKLSDQVAQLAERSAVIPVDTMAAAQDPKTRDAVLAEAFAPRLFLASDRAAWPENPMLDLRTSSQVRLTPRPKDCGTRGHPGCFALTDRCFKYDASCGIGPGKPDYPYGTYAPKDGGAALHPFAVMYVHALHAGDPGFEHANLAPKRMGKVTELLQYWLYYGYDRFDALTPIGRLVQEHESDWEAVSVGLGADKPLFVAYNAHCGGQWLPWSQVPAAYPKAQETARYAELGLDALAAAHEPTHPAVMVAGGSQASYPAAGSVRVPDWTSCTLKTSLGDALAFAASIRETVNVTREVIPVDVPLASVHSLPMKFGGYWGLNNHSLCLKLAFGINFGCGGDAAPGPETPPLKRDWRDPFSVIFHTATWHQGHDPAS